MDHDSFPVLDTHAVTQLRERKFRGQNLFSHTLGIFREQAPRCLDNITNAARDGERAHLMENAHMLKGICATLGARRLWAMADTLVQLRGTEHPVPANLIAGLPAELEAFLNEADSLQAVPQHQ